MTAEQIKLAFDLSPAERARTRDYLTGLQIKKTDGIFGRLANSRLIWVLGLPCMVIIAPNLLAFFENLRHGILPDRFGLSSLIGVAFAVWFLVFEIKTFWTWLRRLLGLEPLGWIGREGVHWGAHRLTATDESLIVELEKCQVTLLWPAVLGVKEINKSYFLILSQRSAIAVPKTAFASETDERSFRDFVGRHISATT